jgi:hypothetical protein
LELVPYRKWPVNTEKGASWTALPLQLAHSSHVKKGFNQESILEWKLMLEMICQPPLMPIAPTIAPTIAVEPPGTPTPLNHISGVVACYKFLIIFIKPEALTSFLLRYGGLFCS